MAEQNKMHYIAHNGTEVIDDTPEAEDRYNAILRQEQKYVKEQRQIREVRRKIIRNPLYKITFAFAYAFGFYKGNIKTLVTN